VNFGFTDEQELLRRQVRKFLDERAPLETVRRLQETPPGYSAELWREMAVLGWLGLLVPERYGGAGLTWVDLIIVLEETGRSLFPSPLVSTVLAAAAIDRAGSEAHRQRYLRGLADGTRIGTLALLDTDGASGPEGIGVRATPDGGSLRVTGTKRFVMDPAAATLFVVAVRIGDAPGHPPGDASSHRPAHARVSAPGEAPGGVRGDTTDDLALAVLEVGSPGVTATAFSTIDQTKRMGSLSLTDAHIAPEALLCRGRAAAEALRALRSLGAIAVAAEAVGAAEEALRLTVAYAKERVQFGHPIGRYQGVKHPLAEMYVDIESFKSLLYYAAWAADEDPAGLDRAASYAKAYVSEAFPRIGIDGVQLHGAVGYTDEFDIQLYLKRAKWVRQAFGDADFHYDRIAALGGL
jgi:alkylation response protein AidB-like acyl-CoA dehydrogenase